jgi:hypothetical protein
MPIVGVFYSNPFASGTGTFTYNYTPSGVPEPSTWLSMILGFGLVGAGLRRRRSLSAPYALARSPA